MKIGVDTIKQYSICRYSQEEGTMLRKHLIDVLNPYIGAQLIGFVYHDVTGKEELYTNNNGIDIIAQQLELRFADKEPLFISWATLEGWSCYSLAASNSSFCTQSETFTPDNDTWENVVGQTLKRFDIYGYKAENSEPHLVTLAFSSGNTLGIANFYFEEDFIPRNSMGDNIWIVFGANNIDRCIRALELEHLYLSA